jgi:hypothetical protein
MANALIKSTAAFTKSYNDAIYDVIGKTLEPVLRFDDVDLVGSPSQKIGKIMKS